VHCPAQHGTFTRPQAHSQPLKDWLSQLPKPALHDEYVQLLFVHATPFAFFTFVVQLFVQLPHCARFVAVFVSQPVLLVPQWLNPVLQVHLQDPAVQRGVPFSVPHTAPH
jgi:hypothetical protein